jgi:hypothetical protein
MELADDVIDTSVWLPKGEAVYTKERLNKGDIRMVNGQPTVVKMNLLTTLRDFDVLDDSHPEAARAFMQWREILAAALGVDKLRGSLRINAETTGLSDDKYVILVKRMKPNYLYAITMACDSDGHAYGRRLREIKAHSSTAYSSALRSLRNTYRDPFDDLVCAVKKILLQSS